MFSWSNWKRESVHDCEETKGLLYVCSYSELRLYLGSSVSTSMLTLSATVLCTVQ